jgi:hypothetical protein
MALTTLEAPDAAARSPKWSGILEMFICALGSSSPNVLRPRFVYNKLNVRDVDRGRQKRDQVDPAVAPDVRVQRSATPASVGYAPTQIGSRVYIGPQIELWLFGVC